MSELVGRYSRQMLVPSVGASGQEKLSSSVVLVVGCGGIGSTVISYLGGAGVGMILCDHDKVEESNLHRQLIHDTAHVGANKAVSAKKRISAQNSGVQVEAVEEKFTASNADVLVGRADLVVDATDNIEARYLINDACMKGGKTLVSGSAVGMEGQISVFIPHKGPCYRCLHPQPSSLKSCKSCADAGVLGPIPGAIGCFQAMEVIKLLLLREDIENKSNLQLIHGKQVFYDGALGDFHTFGLPKKGREDCPACGCGQAGEVPVQENSGPAATVGTAPKVEEVTTQEYADILHSKAPHVVLDVRNETQFQMVSLKPMQLEHSSMELVNIPLVELMGGRLADTAQENSDLHCKALRERCQDGAIPVFTLCRRGVDSLTAAQFLADRGFTDVRNVTGGLVSWSENVESSLPLY